MSVQLLPNYKPQLVDNFVTWFLNKRKVIEPIPDFSNLLTEKYYLIHLIELYYGHWDLRGMKFSDFNHIKLNSLNSTKDEIVYVLSRQRPEFVGVVNL